jgi:hypothetical protein
MTHVYVPRTTDAIRRLRTPPAPPQRDVTLVCGHASNDVVISSPPPRRLLRCPEGCGLQRPRRGRR